MFSTRLHDIVVRILVATALLSSLGACTMSFKSVKAGGGVEGTEYCLPIPMLEVAPQPDGTVKVTPVFLPDPNRCYVIKASSLFSSYTLDVERTEERFLKKVEMKADTSLVAAAAIESAGEVQKANIEAQIAAAKAEAEARKEAAKSLKEGAGEIAVAKAKLEALKASGGSEDEIKNAKVALKVAEAKYNIITSSAAFDAQTNHDEKTSSSMQQVWGPVYYRIEQKRETVKLIPASFGINGEQQIPFYVSKAEKEKGENLSFRINGSSVISKDGDCYKLTVEVVGGLVADIDKDGFKVKLYKDGTDLENKVIPDIQSGGKHIAVSIQQPLTKGEQYSLVISYIPETANKPKVDSVNFQVAQ